MSTQILEELRRRAPSGFGPLPILAALLVLVAIFTSIFTVAADSVGVVLRFGQYHSTADPGLRFKLPFGIDKVHIVPVERQLTLEFGFASGSGSNPHQSSNQGAQEKNMVTGDLNAAEVSWVVQYRIGDPFQYLFRMRNPEETLRHASESVMREVVGDRTVDEVITIGRQEVEFQALSTLQDVVSRYEMGLRIDQIQLRDVQPPEPVKPSFDAVSQAQQEQQRLINEARREYERVIPRAAGEADQRISEAEGYATQRVNEATGDANRFIAIYDAYRAAPEVTRQRLYLETMQELLGRLGPKIILDEDNQQILPLLNLGNNPLNAPVPDGR
jgi:membrane protease subunit HflK